MLVNSKKKKKNQEREPKKKDLCLHTFVCFHLFFSVDRDLKNKVIGVAVEIF